MMGRPAGIRKARTALSVADKKKVLDELKAGKPAVDVAAEFEISRRQVFNILTYCPKVDRGVKAMKAKERLTIIMCANALGTCKIVPVVIGAAKTPRCFKNNPPSVPYYHQQNAWNDSKLYKKWWDEVFVPTIRSFTKDPVALILDGFSGHDERCIDSLGQIRVFKLPPNITSVFQPMDQGIIAALKSGYRNRLLSRLVEVADNYGDLQAMAKQLPQGSAGLQYGCPPHVRDAITLLKQSWDSISPSCITACFVHSHCLPASDNTEITADAVEYSKKLESESVALMCQQLSSLSLSNLGVAGMLSNVGLDVVAKAAQKVSDNAYNMLLQWLHLEDEGMIDENDESEVCTDADVSESPMDKAQLLSEVLPLLEKLHAYGARLSDCHILDAAQKLCLHVKDSTSKMP
eukprot:Em0478g1a